MNKHGLTCVLYSSDASYKSSACHIHLRRQGTKERPIQRRACQARTPPIHAFYTATHPRIAWLQTNNHRTHRSGALNLSPPTQTQRDEVLAPRTALSRHLTWNHNKEIHYQQQTMIRSKGSWWRLCSARYGKKMVYRDQTKTRRRRTWKTSRPRATRLYLSVSSTQHKRVGFHGREHALIKRNILITGLELVTSKILDGKPTATVTILDVNGFQAPSNREATQDKQAGKGPVKRSKWESQPGL